MNIKNVIVCNPGFEMKNIFKALEIVTYAMCGGDKPDVFDDDGLIRLAEHIIHHQLSKSSSKYEPAAWIFPYAEKLVDAYFRNSNDMIVINWKLLHEPEYQLLSDIICDSEYKWIQLDVPCGSLSANRRFMQCSGFPPPKICICNVL
eukprot:640510_1